MPRTDIPVVKNGVLQARSLSLPVGSAQWYEWLLKQKNFGFEDEAGHFTAQCETRRNKGYWYAYRRRAGKLLKLYLGKSDELTYERLQQVSRSLTDQANFRHPPTQSPTPPNIDSEVRIDSAFLPMAKVNVPLLPQKLVTRPRLMRQITTPLTVIYAPSGFGKSTLLNTWKQTCGFPVAWLSLDESDNQPLHFWYSVVMALQTIDSSLGHESLSYLRLSNFSQFPEIISRLIGQILRQTASMQRLGLVLDDFHHIHSPEVYASLQTWLEQFPPCVQLVISGHIRPPLALGHLRARGMLTELDANDLRFTLEEGIDYLLQYPQDPPLARIDIEKLVKHTEGWAAGLTLAALALSKHGNRHQFIATFSGAHIYLREYFMETVLQHSTPEVQDFLVKTAILKQLTGSLCNALTGRTDGEEILSRLWQQNLFIVRLEDQGWYRYHDLFAEMLYSQLQTRFPQEIPQLHQRAAQWYQEQFAPADAIYHLLAIQAWEEAATLMETMAFRELEQFGEDSRLLRWFLELPESIVQQHKLLLFVYLRLAIVALPRQKMENFVAHIEANITRKPPAQQTPDEKEVLIEVRQMRQIWAKGGIFTPPITSGGEHDPKRELLNQLGLLVGNINPNTKDIEERLTQLYETAQAQRNLFVLLMAGGARARLMLVRGQLRRSEKVAQQVLQQALAQRGKLPEPASIALAVLGQVHFERYELDLAQTFLQRAVEVDPNPTSTNGPLRIAIQQAEIQLAQNKWGEARATIQAARELHARRPAGVWRDQDLIAYEALACLRAGNHSEAEQLLNQGGEPGVHPASDLVYAELALARKQFDAALALLQRLISEYPEGMPSHPLLGAQIMFALALFGQHKINHARQTMAEAVRAAAPERFMRPFMEYSAHCLPLLMIVLHTESLTTETKTFIKEILRLAGSPAEQIPSTELAALSTAASISAREQEVLQLMSAGLSNSQIAKKLSIAESTVKTHICRIYSKLGVNGRVQAIAQAKEAQLVQ